MIMLQRGRNDKYPKIIETWGIGEKVPEWLSDNASINFIDGDGNLFLKTRDLSNGGKEIIASDGINVLVRLNTKDSKLCYAKGYPIFSLRPIQLELLYRPQE